MTKLDFVLAPMRKGENILKNPANLMILLILLCVLAMPSVSFAVYDSQYATAADSIFANNSWTNMEKDTVSGADYSYHVWYDKDGVKADYYQADYGTYTAEWLTYSSPVTTQSWDYTAAKDGSYQKTDEYYDYANYDLTYNLYDVDGMSKMSYDFESVDGSYPGWHDYTVDITNDPSGSYDYDYDYRSEDVRWNYEAWNDLSTAQTGEYKSLWDPKNSVQSEYDSWKDTATGAYALFESTTNQDATKSGTTWNWDYSNYSQTSYSQSYSPDLSSYSSTYEKDTYSDAGDTTYQSWDWKVTDSGYYANGYSWQDDINNASENYSESLTQRNGQDFYSKSLDKTTKDNYYESDYYKYMGSGEWYSYEESDDYTTNWTKELTSYYQPRNGETYNETYYLFDDGNKRWSQDEYSSKYDSGDWENDKTIFYSDYTGLSNYDAGTGSYNDVSSGYDSQYQRQSYSKYYYDFAGRPGTSQSTYNHTYEYRYNESSLADSNQKSISWSKNYYDKNSTPANYWSDYDRLTSESYQYYLDSDTNNESWRYTKNDYTGANNTYYKEWKDTYLSTGAYDYSKSYNVTNVSNYSYEKSQDLDEYYEYTDTRDLVKNTNYETEYRKVLAGNGQYWDAQYWNFDTGYEYHTTLVNGDGTNWVGAKSVNPNDGTGYDLYYYSAYPDGYFLEQNLSTLPGTAPSL